MFWALLSSSLLAAGPQPALALTRFRLVQVDPSLGGYAEDRLAVHLAALGFQVTTPADLETVLGLERERQLLGCDEDRSCLAEISAAIGVPLVATGRLTRLGKRLELDVRVIRQKDGRVVATDTRGTDDEARLGDLLQQTASAIAEQLGTKSPAPPFRWRLWVPLAGGVAALAGGGVLIGLAESEYAAFTTTGTNVSVLMNGQIAERYEALATRRGLGIGLAALGAALVVTGFVWNALVPDAPVTAAVSWGPTGAALTLGGTF